MALPQLDPALLKIATGDVMAMVAQATKGAMETVLDNMTGKTDLVAAVVDKAGPTKQAGGPTSPETSASVTL